MLSRNILTVVHKEMGDALMTTVLELTGLLLSGSYPWRVR